MDRTTPPAIHVAGLGRDFGDRSAVHQLDLQVNAGEVYGLLGPNGSGKSTTVRMLTTMLRPSRGTAHVAGADITHDPETVRRRIGIVLQETALDPLMSARELLHLQGRLQSFTARQARDRSAELLVSFSMEEFADTPVSRLSGGRRRRVDLAVALAQRPLVLFLDEPTTGLDPVSRLSGLPALLALVGATVLLGTGFQLLTAAVALHTGSGSAIGSVTLIFFPLSFFTATFVPRDQLDGWMAYAADINPLTSPWSEQNLLPGALVTAGILAAGAVAARLALVRRTRTGV
ncbi:ATP-binding cassette domain-containing protein [Streptosporangium amethystogenes]|uniref:ATP-binding cassette domain-containing protein n=1 Tax=Streptosporangium amethystogenes TaxID=2002 RepID=UPI000A06A617|nr:ATP-binding cassette domain-containing protein [Streptosporangium amethystogenes]